MRDVLLVSLLVLLRLDDCVLRKLVEHPSHLVSDRVSNRVIDLGLLPWLGRIVRLHEDHLLQLAPLYLLLVLVTHPLVHLLQFGLLHAVHLLLLLLAYLPLHRFLALLLEILSDDLVDTRGIRG